MILRTTNRFEKDLKRVKRRGKDLNKLWGVLEVLADGSELLPRIAIERIVSFRPRAAHSSRVRSTTHRSLR